MPPEASPWGVKEMEPSLHPRRRVMVAELGGRMCGQESPLPSCSWLRHALLGVRRGSGEDHVGGT